MQADPNHLVWSPLGQNQQIVTRNGAGANAANKRVSRVPAGHPEGYLEGFANIYSEAAEAILAARDGKAPPEGVLFPTVDDGVKGMAFIDAAIRSSRAGGVWTALAPGGNRDRPAPAPDRPFRLVVASRRRRDPAVVPRPPGLPRRFRSSQ